MAVPLLRRPAKPRPRPRLLAGWLLAVAVLVFLMVVVGGITRLTESGLSMVRWEPISGAVPPTSEAAWQREFDHYRQSPQYAQANRGMTLGDFKTIYFWEYIHRLLARIVGLVFALPLLWFWWQRAIPPGYGLKLSAILALGGLQGVIGWWMVASGLVDRPEVSHVRLAIHLLMALFIFAATLWVAGDLRALARDPQAKPARIPVLGAWALSLLFLQFMFGAYVAGLDAGHYYNRTWPLMGTELYPAGADWLAPGLRNFVDNPVTVQFVHRWLAWAVAALALWLAARAWLARLRVEAAMLAGAVSAQVMLGILTLLSGVELQLAVAHQGMAVLLLGAMTSVAHGLGARPRP